MAFHATRLRPQHKLLPSKCPVVPVPSAANAVVRLAMAIAQTGRPCEMIATLSDLGAYSQESIKILTSKMN
jgi:hypothetical protein